MLKLARFGFCSALLTLIFSIAPEVTAQQAIPVVIDAEVDSYKAVVTTSGTDKWLLDLGVGCSGLWRFEGRTAYIVGSAIALDAVGNKLLLSDDFYDQAESCSIYDADLLLKLWVDKELSSDSDKFIGRIGNNPQLYLFEKGIGCLGLSFKVGSSVLLKLGGSFFDGIGDKVVIPDRGQICRVWNAEEIGDISVVEPPSPPTPVLLPSPVSTPSAPTQNLAPQPTQTVAQPQSDTQSQPASNPAPQEPAARGTLSFRAQASAKQQRNEAEHRENIRNLYRELLSREPAESEVESWFQASKDARWIRTQIEASEEYKKLHPAAPPEIRGQSDKGGRPYSLLLLVVLGLIAALIMRRKRT